MTLCEQLKDILDGHFRQYPNVSINALAMRANVGATTLRRIMSLEIKGEPSPHTVLNIASAVAKEKRLGRLLKMYEGPVGEILQDNFSNFAEQDTPHVYDRDLNELLTDKVNYFIYKLAANRTGVKREEIQDLYGRLGLEKLQELVAGGHVLYKEEAYHAKDKNFSLDLMVIKRHLPELIKFYKPEELDRGQNLFYTLSESLSAEGIKRIKDIQREAVKKTYEIMSSEEFAGEVPYFTIQACDTLNPPQVTGVIQ